MTGRADEALAYLRQVTGMTGTEVNAHGRAANSPWATRSARTWLLDLGMLTDAGVTVGRPDSPEQRRVAADRQLRQIGTL